MATIGALLSQHEPGAVPTPQMDLSLPPGGRGEHWFHPQPPRIHGLQLERERESSEQGASFTPRDPSPARIPVILDKTKCRELYLFTPSVDVAGGSVGCWLM